MTLFLYKSASVPTPRVKKLFATGTTPKKPASVFASKKTLGILEADHNSKSRNKNI